VRPLLEAGRLDPVISSVHPLADAAEALLELDERRALGKVLLSVR
jgi:NADPH:quinone reductase